MYEAAYHWLLVLIGTIKTDRAIKTRLLSHSENEITYGVAIHFGFSKSVLMLLHRLLVLYSLAGFSNSQSCIDCRIDCINSI